jgi:hypothetical protein
MEQSPTVVSELTGSLCCTLLDRRSSVPLGGARITCVGRDNRVTQFDADRVGRFTTTLREGAYDLVISARGYLSLLVRGVGVLGGHKQLMTRALVPGEGEKPECEPATALGGYVTDHAYRTRRSVFIALRVAERVRPHHHRQRTPRRSRTRYGREREGLRPPRHADQAIVSYRHDRL